MIPRLRNFSLFILLKFPEDGGSKMVRNIGNVILINTPSHSRYFNIRHQRSENFKSLTSYLINTRYVLFNKKINLNKFFVKSRSSVQNCCCVFELSRLYIWARRSENAFMDFCSLHQRPHLKPSNYQCVIYNYFTAALIHVCFKFIIPQATTLAFDTV
jgi:hypothetical protein